MIISKSSLLSFAIKFPPWPLTSKCQTEFPLLCVPFIVCTGRHNFCSAVAHCGESLHKWESVTERRILNHTVYADNVGDRKFYCHYFNILLTWQCFFLEQLHQSQFSFASWSHPELQWRNLANWFILVNLQYFSKMLRFNQRPTKFPSPDCSDGSAVIKIDRPHPEEPLPVTTLMLCYLSKWNKRLDRSFDKYTSSKWITLVFDTRAFF